MKKIFYVAVAFIAVACGNNSFQTENGTNVSYLRKGSGELPMDSLVCMFNIRYTTQEGKVMMESEEPMPLKIDPNSEQDQGELFNVLKVLRTGDSVGFELVASELFSKTFKAPIPDSIDANSKIQFQISFIDQLTETGYFEMVAEKAARAAEKQLEVDAEILDDYLSENNIETVETESGLRYIIIEEGSGPKPDSGQVVQVNYTGRILDGDFFDTSNEAVAQEKGLYQEGRPYGPLEFPIGMGRVIEGWDEGISLLNVGSKATLFIPSPLGYGGRAAGPIIKPNSILVFDVELVGISE